MYSKKANKDLEKILETLPENLKSIQNYKDIITNIYKKGYFTGYSECMKDWHKNMEEPN